MTIKLGFFLSSEGPSTHTYIHCPDLPKPLKQGIHPVSSCTVVWAGRMKEVWASVLSPDAPVRHFVPLRSKTLEDGTAERERETRIHTNDP